MAHPNHPHHQGGKRKRVDRTYSADSNGNLASNPNEGNPAGFRPGPYRPGGHPGQHQQQQYQQQQYQQYQQQQFQQQGSNPNPYPNQQFNQQGGARGGGGGQRRGNRGGGGGRGGFQRRPSDFQQGYQQQQQFQAQQHAQAQAQAQAQPPQSQQQHQQQPAQPQALKDRISSSNSSPAPQRPPPPRSPAQSQPQAQSEMDRNAQRATPSQAGNMPPPAIPTPVPAAAAQTPAPTPSPAATPTLAPAQTPQRNAYPYTYDHLTDAHLRNWHEGRPRLLDVGNKARSEGDDLTLSILFQEVIQSVLSGRMPAVDGGQFIRDLVDETLPAEAGAGGHIETAQMPRSTLFLDTLSILTDSDTRNPHLRPFIVSTGISPHLLRQQLDSPLLQSLGLIRDTFVRMGIRKQTNLLYRQSNYNLLREESEGYSKLVTELFTTSNNEPPTSEVVAETFERIKAMIGAFDMDVGRVLDVTLDVFAAVLVKQYRFFVKFLRASSWWPRDDYTLKSGRGEPGLPRWAVPGYQGWSTTDEDREAAAREHEARDRAFW
ncbi:THO complex subunit 2, partial [Ascosphaera atra]